MNIDSYCHEAQHTIDNLTHDSGDWLIAQRRAALRRMSELGFPHTHQEAWRYTSVEGLMEKGFKSAPSATQAGRGIVVGAFLEEQLAARLVFVDGIYHPGMSKGFDRDGLIIADLRTAMALGDQSVLRSVGYLSGVGEHVFSAMNMATQQDGAVIQLSKGVVIEEPIELLHITSGKREGSAHQMRHLIELEEDASLTLIERYISALDDIDYFNNVVCEINLADGAWLKHQRVQQESSHAYHLCDQYLGLGASARYQGVNAALGSRWSRTELHSRFRAEEAVCDIDGLYLVGNGQLTDFHLDIEHAVPRCSSRENFKGILYGAGRGVFDGSVQVGIDAQKTQAHLHNANLMLSAKAEVDTKPELVILADDVKCSHGTTVGQLDQQALFYLRSRGIDALKAQRLLCLGFANEIIDRFETQSLGRLVGEDLARRLRF
jgi:Fe-S cluster assembly protein SufD